MAFSSLPIFFFFIFVSIIIPISHSTPFIVLHGIGDKCSNKGMRKFTKYLSDNSGAKGYCMCASSSTRPLTIALSSNGRATPLRLVEEQKWDVELNLMLDCFKSLCALIELNPSSYREIGNGGWDSWFMTLEEQSQIVCNKVKKMEDLREGFNFVGLSQGNLIGRAVIEFCDGVPPVQNFISLGGPHAGIASVPLCGSGIWCLLADDLMKLAIYSDVVQNSLAPSGYIKLPNDIPDYLEHCKFLPKLNNERPDARNSTYKERFSSLKNLVLIMFEDDTVLVPKETSWFGYYPDGEFEPVLPPQQTKLYIEDWIGLRSLDEGGRVKYIKVAGGHLGISYSDAKKYIVPYLEEEHQPSHFYLQIKTNNVSLSLA